jgi:hypothetical protein
MTAHDPERGGEAETVPGELGGEEGIENLARAYLRPTMPRPVSRTVQGHIAALASKFPARDAFGEDVSAPQSFERRSSR